MMSSVAFIDDNVSFGVGLPEQVNNLLQEAVVAARHDNERAETLFQQAKRLDPGCLHSYFALYKFYFYQARLKEAEDCAIAGLEESARQLGFPADYHHLAETPEKWPLYESEQGLFYLYTLKALAFIRLRQNHIEEGRALLTAIGHLDPEDLSGASVIEELSKALHEESD